MHAAVSLVPVLLVAWRVSGTKVVLGFRTPKPGVKPWSQLGVQRITTVQIVLQFLSHGLDQ